MEILRNKFKNGVKSIQTRSLNGTGGSSKQDPDEKWSNLYREKQRNHLYKWVDEKGGEILTIYDKDGEEGVQRFASEVLPVWLYNDGIMPEELKQEEYIKWRKYMHANLTGGDDISQSDILESIGGKYMEHTVLWKLNKRGVDGETLIHLLLSKGNAKYTEIAKIIIRVYPSLGADIYEGDEFYGQSPLHLAIVNDDIDCVRLLIDSGADVGQRAIGTFFLPEDQKRSSKAKFTNYAGFAYYGEYPLAFAASFGNKDIYDYLIENEADPNAQDSFGNTVLHMCVINNSIEMYSYAVRHWSKPADVNIPNNAGYTPLTLATILGRREIFDSMLELSKVEFWRFSDITYSAYPLTTLDTIRSDGSTNWESALMRVVNGTTSSHLEIVGGEVIQRLLAEKWRLFGEKRMYQRLAFQVFHIFVLSVAVYTRADTRAEDLLTPTDMLDFMRCISEAVTIICCLIYILYNQATEIRAQGLHTYFRGMVQAPEKPICVAANFLIMFCVPCRFLQMHLAEECFLILALPGFWLSLLFYAKGFLMTGPFVVMIYSMVAGDMVRFACLSLVFLVSFSQSFYFLAKDTLEKQRLRIDQCVYNDTIIIDYDSYTDTALTLFRMGLGGYDYEKLYCAPYQTLVKLLFVLFMIIWPIALINMLIAMMGNTYERIITHAEKAWRQQWAQIVILLERSLDAKKLAKVQAEYSIKLNDDRYDDNGDGENIRGLMVIKSTKQTKAKQRKRASDSWKRLSRKVLALLRHNGVERTRHLLHHGGFPVIDSRPASVIGDAMLYPHPHASSGRKSSYASLTPHIRSPSRLADESHKKVAQVVNTFRSSPVPPPPPLHVPATGYESPKFMVHPVQNGESIRTPFPLDNSMLAKKLNALEPEMKQDTVSVKEKRRRGEREEEKNAVVIESAPAGPLSSPCSLSETAPAPASIPRRISSSLIHLQHERLVELPHIPPSNRSPRPSSTRRISRKAGKSSGVLGHNSQTSNVKISRDTTDGQGEQRESAASSVTSTTFDGSTADDEKSLYKPKSISSRKMKSGTTSFELQEQ